MKEIILNAFKKSIKPSLTFFSILFGGVLATPTILTQFFKLSLNQSIVYSGILLFGYILVNFIINIYLETKKLINNLLLKINELENFDNHIDENTFPYVFELNDKISKIIFDKNNLTFDEDNIWKFKVKALAPDVPYIRHQLGKGDKYFLNCKELSIDLICHSGHKCTIRDDRKEEAIYRWHVCIDPPLQQNEIIEYEFRYINKNKFFISNVDLLNALSNDKLSKLNRNLDYSVRITHFPAKIFSHTLEFPHNYPLKISPIINVEKRNIQLKKEVDKVKSSFIYDSNNKVAKFVINNPLLDTSYKVEWVVPSINELVESKFIDNIQAEIIRKKIGANTVQIS